MVERITESEIKEKLLNHYGRTTNRKLVKNKRQDSHETIGSIVYSLSGSPPKGYAIYIPELRQVNLYNSHGKRFRILNHTVVEEIEDWMVYETGIEWARDPEDMEYVRSSLFDTYERKGKPMRFENAYSKEVVGWANLSEDAPRKRNVRYYRRVFWLKNTDRPNGDAFQNKAPAEAVDPLTVSVGECGEKNARAKGNDS